MNKRILIDKSRAGDRTRVAATLKGELLEYDEASSQNYIRAKNTIYNAVIKSIRPELGAAFVQYTDEGDVKDGFLPFSNIASQYYSKNGETKREEEIAKLIKAGDKILVQIKKDQLHHEQKGAALTTFISLAGTYLVLLPLNQKQGISRKADIDQREAIKQTLKDIHVDEAMGIIIRTAGISAKPEEIKWDYKALIQQWNNIKEAHESLPAPCLIHEDENIVTRIIRDSMSGSTEKIICNDKETFQQIETYLRNVRPEILDKEILEFYEHDMMFDHYSLEEQIESIFQVRCSLPSGGQVVMHGTEAGYMVDVNSSKSTFGNNIEENALNTNKQAAIKIADMLRLRDVSGIIYIDFIDMGDEKNQHEIQRVFNERCALDRANVKVEPISQLTGCMPVLRQGLGTVFFKSSLETMSHDESIIIGKRRSVVSYANYMLCVIEKSAAQKTDIIQIQLPVDVATYMLNEERSHINEIETKHGVIVKIIPNENFAFRRYILKRFHKTDDKSSELSHTVAGEQGDEKAWISTPRNQVPHVSRNSDSAQRNGQEQKGVLSRLWDFFGSNTTKSTNKHKQRSRHKHNQKRPNDARRRNDNRPRHNETINHQDRKQDEKTSGNQQENIGNQTRTKRTSVNRRRGPQSHSRNKRSAGENSATKDLSKFDD